MRPTSLAERLVPGEPPPAWLENCIAVSFVPAARNPLANAVPQSKADDEDSTQEQKNSLRIAHAYRPFLLGGRGKGTAYQRPMTAV